MVNEGAQPPVVAVSIPVRSGHVFRSGFFVDLPKVSQRARRAIGPGYYNKQLIMIIIYGREITSSNYYSNYMKKRPMPILGCHTVNQFFNLYVIHAGETHKNILTDTKHIFV